MIFIHSAGGGGKTFVSNTIAAAVRSNRNVALCVASSGIASLLLSGGHTAHSRLKIPIPALENSIATIKHNSDLHEVLMQHKHAIDSVDHALQDLLHKNSPFGGITVIFGGDFCQTLPIVPKGLRQEIIASSLCRGHLWKDIDVHFLVQNMHLKRTPDSEMHAAWLLEIGSGKNLDETETVKIPQSMCCTGNSLKDLINSTYPNLTQNHSNPKYFLDRTILSCKNDDVDEINSAILEIFPGEERVLMSADSVQLGDGVPDGYQPYPAEYLNSLRASGLPLARLTLKHGCPVMLLCNLDPSKGLCNGTRMIVTDI